MERNLALLRASANAARAIFTIGLWSAPFLVAAVATTSDPEHLRELYGSKSLGRSLAFINVRLLARAKIKVLLLALLPGRAGKTAPPLRYKARGLNPVAASSSPTIADIAHRNRCIASVLSQKFVYKIEQPIGGFGQRF